MELQLPKLSATMETGRIAQWLKRPGETVSAGDILYELETDKTVLEVESPVAGILEAIVVPDGAEAPTGAVVCVIRTSADGDGDPSGTVDIDVPAPQEEQKEKPPAVVNTPPKAQPETVLPVERFRSSPSARRLAGDWGLDIRRIAGTGPLGRVRNRDVKAHAERASKPGTPSVMPQSSGSAHAGSVRAVTPMRRIIAREMVRSQQTIPAFWVEKWVRAETLLRSKELLEQSVDHGQTRVTVTDFLIQAVGLALARHLEVNRRWVDRDGAVSIEEASGSHVGLAVSLEEGILVPVIEQAGDMPLAQIAVKRREVVEAARSRSAVPPGEPAVITLSNLGRTGVDRFRAIVRPEESMILAVGALQERVIPVDGQPAVGKGFNLTLSADHRIIDGRNAAEFLADIAEIVETGRWRLFR